MKNLNLILFFFISFSALSEDAKDLQPIVILDSIQKDSSLKTSEGAFTFSFKNLTIVAKQRTIRYSMNGIEGTINLDFKNQISITVKPGKYKFQFYYSSSYYEIYTDSILAKSQSRSYVSLFCRNSQRDVMVEKPVIYLYPEKPCLVDVKVNPKGKFTFTYPEYKNGWKVSADPSGELTFENKKINYLFWESAQQIETKNIEFDKGFAIEGSKTLEFLEVKLTEFGLNSKEKADFITFWVPQLMKNKYNFVHFIFNDAANQFAELDVSPKPDHIYRLYMLSFPIESLNQIQVTEQNIPKMERSGFTVIEWGGSQIPKIETFTNLN
jgi:hypothetical protein